MRVTFLGQNSPDKYSGGRFHAWMMAEAAAFTGHEVRFVTDYEPCFYDDFSAYVHHKDIRIDHVPLLKSGGWDIPGHDCDVLVVIPHAAWTPYYYLRARLFAARRRARLVMINFETPNWFNSLAPTPRDAEEWNGWKLCSEGASMILSISREGTKFAREYYSTCPKHTLFSDCYPAINSIVADSVVAGRREKRILLLGRFEQGSHKGMDSVGDLLCESMRGYTLVLVSGIGEATRDFARDLESRASMYGVKIEFLYRISDERKYRELKRASLMLFPSHFEGFGLPPVEAQYCGTPCIAYDLPVLREVSGNEIEYVPPGDVRAFRDRIGEVLHSETDPAALQSGIAHVARFESFSTRVDRVLLEAVEQGRTLKERRLRSVGERVGLGARLMSLFPGRVARSARRTLAGSAKSSGLKKPGGNGNAARETTRTEGTLFWYAEEKGFGFIAPKAGDRLLFVHDTFVEDPSHFSFVTGAEVEFETVAGDKGLEARGVRLTEKCGFSQCAMDPASSSLSVKGWYLGREIEKVEAYLDGGLLGSGVSGLGRQDVLEKYPEYKNSRSGWRVGCTVSGPVAENTFIEVRVFPKGGPCRVLRKPLQFITDETEPGEDRGEPKS